MNSELVSTERERDDWNKFTLTFLNDDSLTPIVMREIAWLTRRRGETSTA